MKGFHQFFTSSYWRSNFLRIFLVLFWRHTFLLSSDVILQNSLNTSFQLACDIHHHSSHGASNKPIEPSTTFPLPAEEGWLPADIQEIKRYYLAAKADCENFLLSYTIDEQSLPEYWPNTINFGRKGQPKCRGTPQLFQITKGLLAWPFGPLNHCPTYRKCWFGVLTCGRVDLESMRALIHPRIMERYKEMAKITDPIIRALLNPHVPSMKRWSIRALRMAMRVIGTELVIPEQRLLTLENVSRSRSKNEWSWQSRTMYKEKRISHSTVDKKRREKNLDPKMNNVGNNVSRIRHDDPLTSSRSSRNLLLYPSKGDGTRVGISDSLGMNTKTSVQQQFQREWEEGLQQQQRHQYQQQQHEQQLQQQRQQQQQKQRLQQQYHPSQSGQPQPVAGIRMGLVKKISPTNADHDNVFDLSDDIIIAQYTLTHPSSNNQLEIRQETLHLSALLDWDVAHREILGMDMFNGGSIYLGGTETRCRFFGAYDGCQLPQQMKKCVNESYLTGTPIVVDAPDGGITHCPMIARRKQGLEPPLPLCKAGSGSNPGRWIQASALSLHPHRCDPNVGDYYSWPYPYTKIRNNQAEVRDGSSINTTGRHGRHDDQPKHDQPVFGREIPWIEASGDPCLIRSKYKIKYTDKRELMENMAEELHVAHWFYAPYQCRYHFYTPIEAIQCFQQKHIKKIVLIGDSMNRDLYNWLTEFFKGINVTAVAIGNTVHEARDKLKYTTNVLKQKQVHFDGGKDTTLIPSISFISNVDGKIDDLMKDLGIIPIQKKRKRNDKGTTKQPIDLIKKGTPNQPIDLVITNHAIAHKGPSYWPEFVRYWQANEELFWKLFHNGTYVQQDGHGQTSKIPKYRIFQGPMAYFGATRYYENNDESFLRALHLLRTSYESLGFMVLSDYLLTNGKFLPNDDGLHFFGTGRQMEVTVLMNMICNDLRK